VAVDQEALDRWARFIYMLRTEFCLGELAYLSLTSKNEGPVRDRLAALLHRCLPDRAVGREYTKVGKRTDLVILRRGQVCEAVEMKACFSFELDKHYPSERRRRNLIEPVLKDLKKIEGLFPDASLRCAVIIVTHPGKSVPCSDDIPAKYTRAINKFTAHWGPDWFETSDCTLRWEFDQLEYRVRLAAVHDAGVAFGVPVQAGFWLVW
jgi:hypothetical protein